MPQVPNASHDVQRGEHVLYSWALPRFFPETNIYPKSTAAFFLCLSFAYTAMVWSQCCQSCAISIAALENYHSVPCPLCRGITITNAVASDANIKHERIKSDVVCYDWITRWHRCLQCYTVGYCCSSRCWGMELTRLTASVQRRVSSVVHNKENTRRIYLLGKKTLSKI